MAVQMDSNTQFADKYTLHSFLNCYLREYAIPNDLVTFDATPDFTSCSKILKKNWLVCAGFMLTINLPKQNHRIAMLVDNNQTHVNYRYLSDCFIEHQDGALTPLETIQWLLKEACLHFEQPYNNELFEQITHSRDFLKLLLAEAPLCQKSPAINQDYLASEQQMALGHAFHPAPKARLGFSETQLKQYSPEFGNGFKLHYFAVPKTLIQQKSLSDIDATDIINQDLPAQFTLCDDRQLIPCHPWQAQFIKQIPVVKSLLSDGTIEDIGEQGHTFYATSSVRTLYSAKSDYFYKGSLHVRLTNCLRKNAIYELDTALALSKVLESDHPFKTTFPECELLHEPAYITVNLGLDDAQENRLVQEAFAMIFRENLSDAQRLVDKPKVAGALFCDNPFGPNRARNLIGEYARATDQGFYQGAVSWFSAYATPLIHSMFYAYFARGIVFEPHLQNVLIGFQNNLPAKIFLRDMEGTKLVKNHAVKHTISSLDAAAQQAVQYDQEKGWCRVSYCLFINNLCQAIFYIAGGDPVLNKQLWAKVGDIINQYLQRFPNPNAQQKLSSLLNGEPLLNKGNLMLRLQKHADKLAEYIPMSNPIINAFEHNDQNTTQPTAEV